MKLAKRQKSKEIQQTNQGSGICCGQNPVLPFLVFLEKGRENHQKDKNVYPYRTPKIPGKEGKNGQKTRNSSQGEKNKEFPKIKERKDREVPTRRWQTEGAWREEALLGKGFRPKSLQVLQIANHESLVASHLSAPRHRIRNR